MSLPTQVRDLHAFLRDAGLGDSDAVDVCGFSFGGRVALEFAASAPRRVRRLCVTSVGRGRGALGPIVLDQWKALLQDGACETLKPFALASIMASHHPRFLELHTARLPGWVRLVAEANTRAGIEAIVTQTFGTDPGPAAAACGRAGVVGLLACGDSDRLLDMPRAAEELAAAGGFRLAVHEACGHAVPLEADRAWRRDVLKFLDEAPSSPNY